MSDFAELTTLNAPLNPDKESFNYAALINNQCHCSIDAKRRRWWHNEMIRIKQQRNFSFLIP